MQDHSKEHLTPLSELMEDLHPSNTQPTRPLTRPDTIYECDICHDSHFVHPLREGGKPDYSRVVPCVCSEAQLWRDKMQAMLRLCELPPGTGHMTFENFVRRPGTEEAYGAALDVAGGEPHLVPDWLTLLGDSNRGKTHLLISTCRRWLSTGKPAHYSYVPLLLDELRRGFNAKGDQSYESRFDFFLNVPLLALDDLGTEQTTDWVREKLDTIIDYRIMHGLALVVNCNVPLKDLNFRIRSRLERGGRIVFIKAPEYVADEKKS